MAGSGGSSRMAAPADPTPTQPGRSPVPPTEIGGGGTKKKKTVEKTVQYPRTSDRVISAPGYQASGLAQLEIGFPQGASMGSCGSCHTLLAVTLCRFVRVKYPSPGSPLLNNYAAGSTVAVATATDRSRPRRAGVPGRACSGPVSLFGAIASTSDRRRPERCSRPA